MKIASFLPLLIAMGLAADAWAGWVVTYKKDMSGETEQQLIEDGKFTDGEAIATGDTLIMLDHKRKRFWKGTVEGLCSEMKQFLAAIQESLPPEFREKAAEAAQLEVRREELGTAEIAGYQSRGYRFYVGGDFDSEVWVSRDPRLAAFLRDVAPLEAMIEKFGSCLGSPMGGFDLDESPEYKEVTKGAWVMKESTGKSFGAGIADEAPGGGKLLFKTVVSIEQKDVPDSAFEPPAGYEQVDELMRFMKQQ